MITALAVGLAAALAALAPGAAYALTRVLSGSENGR